MSDQEQSKSQGEIAEVKEKIEEKLEVIEEKAEKANTPEEIASIKNEIEELKTWAMEQIGNPLTTLREEMAALTAQVKKLSKKEKSVTQEAAEQVKSPLPVPVPEIEPKAPAEKVEKFTRL